VRKKRATQEKAALTQPVVAVKEATASDNGVPTSHGKPVAEEVRLRAYLKWEAAGRPIGDGIGFWVDAERELAPAQ
jgi:hypothetical protein